MNKLDEARAKVAMTGARLKMLSANATPVMTVVARLDHTNARHYLRRLEMEHLTKTSYAKSLLKRR